MVQKNLCCLPGTPRPTICKWLAINWMMNQIFKKAKCLFQMQNGDFQAFPMKKDLATIIHLIATSHFQGSLEKTGGTPWGFHIH